MLYLFPMFLFLTLPACDKPGETAPAPVKAEAPAPTPKPAPKPPPQAAPVSSIPADSPLLSPDSAKEQAPAEYKVKFETTQGEFSLQVTRAWAPQGADRFYNLVKMGYYDNVAFFRAVKGFMVQFGIHGDPLVNTKWREARITDDKPAQSNTRGRITFATSGADSRTVQVFINFGDNSNLDAMGFSPFGEVAGEGMKIVDSLYTGYGEGAPRGRGPNQMLLQQQGNAYLQAQFPQLDYLKKATIE